MINSKTIMTSNWAAYIETPLDTVCRPTKIDEILAKRMVEFMRAKQTRSLDI